MIFSKIKQFKPHSVVIIFFWIILIILLQIFRYDNFLLSIIAIFFLFIVQYEVSRNEKLIKKLQRNKNRFRELLDSLPNIAIHGYDENQELIYWNKTSEHLYGYKKEEVMGKKFKDLTIEDNIKDKTIKKIKGLIEKGIPIIPQEIKHKNKNGNIIPVYSSFVLLKNNIDLPEFFCIDIDLVEREKSESKFKFLASYDPLTGLLNKSSIFKKLDQVINKSARFKQKFAQMFIDLDNFKIVNDTMGHHIGDILLKDISKKMQDAMRNYDKLGRFGGDEFILIVENIENIDSVIPVCKKIISIFEKPFKLKNYEAYVTASIGISIYPENGESREILLKNSDIAMYRAKQDGKNRYQFFTAQMNQTIQKRVQLEQELRIGLKNNEFYLNYQPQVDLKSKKILGVEALIRWKHNEKIYYPKEFLDIAKETGLIVPISEFVFKEACKVCQTFQKNYNEEFFISINLPSIYLKNQNLNEVIFKIIKRYNLKANSLEIEISEKDLMEDYQSIEKTVKEFKLQGIKIAVDDYGTGYSSLNFLKTFPIDKAKIDKILIKEIQTDEVNQSLLSAIISLCKKLNISICIEGIEQQKQLDFIINKDCKMGQGHLFSKALSIKELKKII